MENLRGAGRRITAPVGREVKRTFSEFGRFSAGLPCLQTREAYGQDFRDFRHSLFVDRVNLSEIRWRVSERSHGVPDHRAFTEIGLSAASQAASHASISCWK
jgi:hypothetical protein